jgi:hypothetical protein
LLLGAEQDLSRNLHIVNRHDPVGVMALPREHGGSLIRHFLQDDGRFEYSGAMIWMDSQGKFKAPDSAAYLGYMRIMNYVWSCFRDDAKDHGALAYVQNFAELLHTLTGIEARCRDAQQTRHWEADTSDKRPSTEAKET